RHLLPSSPQSGFTTNDAIRILAHNLDFWIPAVTEAREDEMRTWCIVDSGIKPGPVKLSNGEILDGACMGGPRVGADIWAGEDQASEFVARTVEAADKTGRLRDILDAVAPTESRMTSPVGVEAGLTAPRASPPTGPICGTSRTRRC